MFKYDENTDIGNIVKTMLLMRGLSMRKLAKILTDKNKKNCSQSNISQKLSKGTIRFNEVKEIADILGYKIIIEEK